MLEASAGRRLDIGAAGQVENKIGAMDFTVRPADVPSWSSIFARNGMYVLTGILGISTTARHLRSLCAVISFLALLGDRESATEFRYLASWLATRSTDGNA